MLNAFREAGISINIFYFTFKPHWPSGTSKRVFFWGACLAQCLWGSDKLKKLNLPKQGVIHFQIHIRAPLLFLHSSGVRRAIHTSCMDMCGTSVENCWTIEIQICWNQVTPKNNPVVGVNMIYTEHMGAISWNTCSLQDCLRSLQRCPHLQMALSCHFMEWATCCNWCAYLLILLVFTFV